jgi:ornithine carbamoyltransferase
MSAKRDFLNLSDLTPAEHEKLFTRAAVLKAERKAGKVHDTLAGKTLAILLEKNSTRTRLSFEAAIHQLGGHAITLVAAESQMSRGEPVQDTARVASGYADCIVYRTFGDERMQLMAKYSTVPVINGLTDGAHPVQLLADLLTVRERMQTVAGKVVAWVGDGTSNMARSWIEAARIFGFELRIASPDRFSPSARDIDELGKGAKVRVGGDPKEAVRGADVVNTDVWTSMGQEAETKERLKAFNGFIVDSALMALAKPSAIVLHCLPAHRGEEISDDVVEGKQSAIFDQAENRMHAQKALLELLLGKL